MLRHYLFLLGLVASVLACTSDLNVQTTGASPSSATEPESSGVLAELRIAADAYTNVQSFEVTWAGIELRDVNGEKGFSLTVATDEQCKNAIASFENIQDTKLLLEHLVDATYYLCLHATDKAGHKHAAVNNGLAVVVDRLAPHIILPSGATYHSSFNLDASVTELHLATLQWSQVSGPGSTAFSKETSPTTQVFMNQDGTYVLRLTAQDKAGNSASAEITVIWNTSAPIFTSLVSTGDAADDYVNDTEKSGITPLWALTASGYDAVQYTSALDDTVSITCDSSKTYGQPAIARATDLPAVDKPYVICVKLVNAAGVTYGKSSIVTRDIAYPVFTSLVGAHEAGDGYVNNSETASGNALLTLTANGQSSTKYTAVLADSALTCDASKTYSESSIPAINTIPGADGAYAVCVELKDAAGNITYGKSDQIVRDTNAPTVNVGADKIVKATASINATTGGTPTTYAWTKQSGSGTITFGTPSAEDTTAYASADDTYVLRLTVTDAAGNSAYDELNFTWDTIPPTFTSLLGANQASDGYINASETSSASAAFTLIASDYDAESFTAILNDDSPVACDASQSYQGPSMPVINAIPGVDASYAICVRLTDTAGNVTYGKSQTIIRDTVAPSVNVGGDVTASATHSIDATTSGAIIYAWTKESGTGTITFGSASAEDTTVLADGEDSFVLRLTVTDAAGNSAYDELNFTWQILPLSVDAGADQCSSVNSQRLLNAVSTGASSYAWSHSSGPGQCTINTPNTEDTQVSCDTVGTHAFNLTVENTLGEQESDSVVVEVKASGAVDCTGAVVLALPNGPWAASGYQILLQPDRMARFMWECLQMRVR